MGIKKPHTKRQKPLDEQIILKASHIKELLITAIKELLITQLQ
jgi:hypothetical protein